MKKFILPGFLFLLFNLFSCQFHISINKGLNTDDYWYGDGITCDYVSVKIDGKLENRNTFLYGESVYLVFENVTGFTKVEGKVFPKVSIYIIKNEKDTILSNPNLMPDEAQNGININPLQINTNFDALLDYKFNEKYKVGIRISDLKGKGKLIFEMPFSVKENDFYQIKNSQLKYSRIYLWDETENKSVASPKINLNHSYFLVFEGLQGFEEVANKVFPVFSNKILNDDGKLVAENKDIFTKINNKGIYPSDFKRLRFFVEIFFPPEEKLTKHFKIIGKVKDRHSGESILVTLDVEK